MFGMRLPFSSNIAMTHSNIISKLSMVISIMVLPFIVCSCCMQCLCVLALRKSAYLQYVIFRGLLLGQCVLR